MNADLFEIIRTTRSMRRLKPDPVPAALITQILAAGTSAPSGGNMQPWRFLVIRDPAIKAQVAQWVPGVPGTRSSDRVIVPGRRRPDRRRSAFSGCWRRRRHLADHLHEAPVWIVPCLQGGTHTRTSGSSIYPAVQNMLLAARALGLGATLTTAVSVVRERRRSGAGFAGGHALLRHFADRLSGWQIRPGGADAAGGCGVCRSMGNALDRRIARPCPPFCHTNGFARLTCRSACATAAHGSRSEKFLGKRLTNR